LHVSLSFDRLSFRVFTPANAVLLRRDLGQIGFVWRDSFSPFGFVSSFVVTPQGVALDALAGTLQTAHVSTGLGFVLSGSVPPNPPWRTSPQSTSLGSFCIFRS
jgi:hypothetical protein